MAASTDLSNFGPRAMEYFNAAKRANGSIHNENGTVNKANLSGLKADVSKLPQASVQKHHAQLNAPKDAVAFSSEARGSHKHSDDGAANRFAAAWS